MISLQRQFDLPEYFSFLFFPFIPATLNIRYQPSHQKKVLTFYVSEDHGHVKHSFILQYLSHHVQIPVICADFQEMRGMVVAKPDATVQECVSTFLSAKPPDITSCWDRACC